MAEHGMETGESTQKESPSLTLAEIREVYERLGIDPGEPEPPRSFEEYAWRYGFSRSRRNTTLDPTTKVRTGR